MTCSGPLGADGDGVTVGDLDVIAGEEEGSSGELSLSMQWMP